MAELLSAALPVECSRASLNGATLDVEADVGFRYLKKTYISDSFVKFRPLALLIF